MAAVVVAQDFVSGCFGGAAQLVVGHPFDTIKVRLTDDADKQQLSKVRLIYQPLGVDTGQATEPAETSTRRGTSVQRSSRCNAKGTLVQLASLPLSYC